MHLNRPRRAQFRVFASSLVMPAALGSSGFVTGVMAQGVLVAPPTLVEPMPVAAAAGTNQLTTVPPDQAVGAGAGASANRGPLDWGPIHLHPHFAYQFLYATAVQAQPGLQSDTATHTVSPGLLFELGDHWTLDYTPSLQYYSSSRFRDSLSHAVALNGQTTYEAWRFGLSQTYSSSSAPLIETGSQTDQENYLTGLSAAYQINSKLSLDLAANQNFRFAEQFTSSREWSTLDWLNYQFLPQLGAGLGGGFGYVDVGTGADMLFEQAQGRVTWQPGTKLSLTLSGGMDDRQFLGSQVPDLINPIFAASIQYHLFEPTTLSLNASRTVNPSYFSNQASETALVNAGIQQRLLRKLQLGINGGYATADYVSTSSQIRVNRTDEYFYFGISLSYPFLQRGTVGVFYQHSENASNANGFGYSSDQGGVNVAYRF